MECSSLIQHILDKGKRGAAEYIKNSRSPEYLDLILDIFLNHETPINDNESIEWIKWLIAGGETPDDFTTSVKKFNNATTCGLVWTAQFVAYRCRTCGISPCMSLCADCFLKGHHEGHDFNMFRSQAGGACDCGDASVMKAMGFCNKHGVSDNSESMTPPPDLLYIAGLMAPRIFLRLVLHLRNFKRNSTSGSEVQVPFDADDFLAMLSEFSGMGAAMRRVLTSALVNPQVYHKLLHESTSDDPSYAAFMTNSKSLYEEALTSLENPDPPPEFEDCPGLQKTLEHKTFLEELVFWTVKYEFPQNVVCFLLNMLPDVQYKEALTEAFVVHYSRIAMVLEKASDPDTLSNRVVHVSVQLFSNEQLAVRMTEKFYLLEVMVVSLKNMMSRILIPMPITSLQAMSTSKRERPHVVNCAQPVMNQHCYWPLVSDLNNVLSHRPVAVKFMENQTLTNMWFSYLSYFQGMNVNIRELSQHVEFEPGSYYAAFSAELEASAYPMWTLLSHLNNESFVPYTKCMLRSCLAVLESWINAVIVLDTIENNVVSFHIPLHRYLATFICRAVNVQQLPLNEVLPSRLLIERIMLHPLRIQAAFYEIVNGLWVRNGLQIKGQAMTYIQCHFCSSMVDADLYLLQILATQLPAVLFMRLVTGRFHIYDWLSFFNKDHQTNPVNNDTPMLESFLQFLATLCSNRTNLGIEYYGSGTMYPVLTRLEMITLLCVADRTHSQLMEMMPERCGTGQSRDFDAILDQVADYKPPNFEVSGHLKQGLYVPKPCVWEELYDPIHVLLRAVQNKKDFQNSLDRFTAYVRQNNLLSPGMSPWPPFRIPKACNPAYKDPRTILNTRMFHAIIWVVLYKYTHEKNVTEHTLSLAVYLLEIALTIAPKAPATPVFHQVHSNETPELHVRNLKLETWFSSDHLSTNLRTVIKTIMIPSLEYLFCFENAAAIEWQPPSESQTNAIRLTIRFGNGASSNTYNADTVPGDSSTSLVPANSRGRSHGTQAASSHSHFRVDTLVLQRAYSRLSGVSNADADVQPSSSSTTSSNVSGETPSDVQWFPSGFPVRKPNSQTRKSAPVTPAEVDDGEDMHSLGASSVPDMKIFNANESIISLLLRIHSILSGYQDSFRPDLVKMEELDVRIGDGAAFVGKALTRIIMLDEACRSEVAACRERLWPKQQYNMNNEHKDVDGNKLSDKKRKAMERQRKMMESFASQREEFAKKNMNVSGEDKMDWEASDTIPEQILVTQKQYDCVICGQSSASTDENPIGLVIHVQATSVLGHKRKFAERAVLPISDKDRMSASYLTETLSNDFQKRMEEYSREFSEQSLQQSVNFGWEGGIYVQTCGHHLHLDCLLRYLVSLPGNRGEYSCPMCRQSANSVLPVPPDDSNVVACCKQNNIFKAVTDIGSLIHSAEPKSEDQKKSMLTSAIERSVDDMMASMYMKFVQSCIISEIFVTSVARTNLEIDIVQRGGSLLKPVLPASSAPRESLSSLIVKKSSCILPLLHVLATHACTLDRVPVWIMWQQLTGTIFVEQNNCSDRRRAVPLLLRDPVALLIQFVLVLPLNMDQTYFTCIVKFLYNLLYFQVVTQLSCQLKEAERNYFRQVNVDLNNMVKENFSLDHAMKYAIVSMDKALLYLEDNVFTVPQDPAYETLELKIQELCLPFLRVASVLRHHMYNEELPEVLVEADEFVRLVYYLELVSHGMDRSKFNSSVVFTWKDEKLDFVEYWFEQFQLYAESSRQITAHVFLSDLHIPWKQPKLLQLPYEYDKIFQYYQRKTCSSCNLIPNEGSICLICGTLVCFKQRCCKREKVHEATQHAKDCGAGTAIFLVVTSSCVIVIRGRKACVWGSVYLDVFGEEDRNLKRGKPLYLSAERYQLLERQWLTHSFDHTSKKWVSHGDGL